MDIAGEWNVEQVLGKRGTKNQSGCKITLSQFSDDLKSVDNSSSQKRPRHGTLKLTGNGIDIEMSGKMLGREEYGKKAENSGSCTITFVPGKKLEADEFTALYMQLEKTVTVEFEDDQKSIDFKDSETAEAA